jgi:hypothetical protein
MYKNALLAGATALLLAGPGIAIAADVQTPPGSGSLPSDMNKSEADMNKSSSDLNKPSGDLKSSTDMTTPSGAIKLSSPFSADLKGKDLFGPDGTKIGDIHDVVGDKLIVGVGGFLGIGERRVELGPNQVTQTGSGNDIKLTTTLTKDELKAMPEWKAPETPRAQRAPNSMSPPASNPPASSR